MLCFPLNKIRSKYVLRKKQTERSHPTFPPLSPGRPRTKKSIIPWINTHFILISWINVYAVFATTKGPFSQKQREQHKNKNTHHDKNIHFHVIADFLASLRLLLFARVLHTSYHAIYCTNCSYEMNVFSFSFFSANRQMAWGTYTHRRRYGLFCTNFHTPFFSFRGSVKRERQKK